jgi:hypothetical protein
MLKSHHLIKECVRLKCAITSLSCPIKMKGQDCFDENIEVEIWTVQYQMIDIYYHVKLLKNIMAENPSPLKCCRAMIINQLNHRQCVIYFILSMCCTTIFYFKIHNYAI